MERNLAIPIAVPVTAFELSAGVLRRTAGACALVQPERAQGAMT